MRSSNDRESFLHIAEGIFFSYFGSRQIYELKIPFLVNHKILRLYVPAYNRFLCKILKDENYRSSIELAVFSRQQPNFFKYVVQVLSPHQLTYIADEVVSLELGAHRNQKWTGYLLKDFAFLYGELRDIILLYQLLAY